MTAERISSMTPLATVWGTSSVWVTPSSRSIRTYSCSHWETVVPVATIWYWATLTMAYIFTRLPWSFRGMK